jgi:hypothetical protein
VITQNFEREALPPFLRLKNIGSTASDSGAGRENQDLILSKKEPFNRLL